MCVHMSVGGCRMESCFSSAEALLSVTGREKQAFHSGEIKLELKNQNIWVWHLQIGFLKCAASPSWLFLHLQKVWKHLDNYQLPGETRLASPQLDVYRAGAQTAAPQQRDAPREKASIISCRICSRNTRVTVTAPRGSQTLAPGIKPGESGWRWRSSQSSTELGTCRNAHKGNGSHHIAHRLCPHILSITWLLITLLQDGWNVS